MATRKTVINTNFRFQSDLFKPGILPNLGDIVTHADNPTTALVWTDIADNTVGVLLTSAICAAQKGTNSAGTAYSLIYGDTVRVEFYNDRAYNSLSTSVGFYTYTGLSEDITQPPVSEWDTLPDTWSLASGSLTYTQIPINIPSLENATLSIFDAFMETATGDKSVFKKAMDKIETIEIDNTQVSSGAFSDSEKAKLIADMSSSIVASITNAAMSTALTIAKEDRDKTYEYSLAVADAKLKDANAVKVLRDQELIKEQADKIAHDNLHTQALLKREYGVTNTWSEALTSRTDLVFSPAGNKYSEMMVKEAQANQIHMKSLRESGQMEWLSRFTDAEIAEGKSNFEFAHQPRINPEWSTNELHDQDGNPLDVKLNAGLIAMQTRTQHRQYKSFNDNMLQHAVNATANMIGLLITDNSYGYLNCAVEQWNIAYKGLVPGAIDLGAGCAPTT